MDLDDEMKAAVAAILADRIWEKIESSIEELTLISVPRAAGMLDISTSQFRRVAEEMVDMGPRDAKVTIYSLRALLSKRKVLKKRKVRRGTESFQ